MSRSFWGLFAALALPLAAEAAPSASIKPVVEPPGVAFPSRVVGYTFCDPSQRAVVLLQDGSIVGVDAKGAMTTLASLGRVTFKNAITCDSGDRIHVARGSDVTMIDRGGTTTTGKLAIDPMFARALDD